MNWISIPVLSLFTGPLLVSKETDPAYSFPTPWIVFPRSEIPQNNFERFFKPYLTTIRARLVLGSDPKHIGPDYNSDPICYRVRLNEIGSELIFGSDWKKSDPITQKPVRPDYPETGKHPSILWIILGIEEGVIRRGRRPRRITPFSISIIIHMIRKPN